MLQLKATLSAILELPGAIKPDRVRFFRNQMQTIISRALTELEIKPIASRRVFSLLGETGQAALTLLAAFTTASRVLRNLLARRNFSTCVQAGWKSA